jgi:hypothetical protein
MNISREKIFGWSGYRVAAGGLSLGLVPDVGGRIMSLAFGGEELLYAHEPEFGKIYDFSRVADLKMFKKEFGFRILGGDKTWVAPEYEWIERIPPLELDAGSYDWRETGDEIIMTSPVCRETGLQVTRRIRLGLESEIHLQEDLYNATTLPVTKGIWNVTQIKKPFDVLVPAGLSDVRSYHYEDDTLPSPGIAPRKEGEWVRIPCLGKVCYKFGAMLCEGQAVVIKDTPRGRVRWSRSFAIDPSVPYAHSSMVEVFNSALFDYGECEIHSPLYQIPPGGRVSFKQSWKLEWD